MALQTSNLTLVGLGSAKDTPPNSEQPPLIDGIHLRWAFKRELGFPWHGFYLFRRVHNPGTLSWLSQHTANLPPGPFGSNSLDTPLGRVFSDTNFVLTENFPPPPNAVEFDLANRNVLGMVFPEQTPVRRVDARIGFRLRPGDSPPTKSTISFRNRATGQFDNPLMEQGCSFTSLDQQNRVREHTVIRSIQTDTETITGLGCKFKLEITLPQSANFVEVKLTGAGRRNALDGAPTIEIFNGQTRLAIVSMKDASSRTTETHLLTGTNITRIVIDEQLSPVVPEVLDSQDRLILNEVTFGNGTLYEVGLTAFAGTVPVREKTARGYAGRIVTEQLEFEGITSVEISSGPAALIDLGTVPFTQDSTNGWAKLTGVPYPLRLPITHPDYPCTPQAQENFSAARQLATDRIKYGSPQQFTGAPTPVTNTGTISVTNGSPIVVGTNTNWTNALVDAVVQASGDATVYSIVMVVSPTKLVLSRNYAGPSRNGAQYNISRDKFGQFYSYLANLVAGGKNAGSMVTRTLPAPVTKSGTIALQKNSAVVTGTGTSWTASLAGLDLELNDTLFTIASVESSTKLTLEKAYQGDNESGLSYSIRPRLQSSTTGAIAPRMPAQLPLDLVLMGSLHPAVAQMSGLYWADVTADPDLKYDYLIVSDHNNAAQLNPDTMLNIIGQSGFTNLDAAIVYDLRVAPAPAPARPKDLEVYALPGSSRLTQTGNAEEAVNNVGLRWDLNKTDAGVLLPGSSVMYHLWRANLGNGTLPNATPPQYNLVTKNWPILVVDSSGARPVSPDWPPFALHALDNALADGWWGYQVSGIDVFGRHTPNSVAAAWRQWSPVPEPKPWYYQDPPSDAIVHQSAIRLLTKVAPPQPTAIDASAIDPKDPMVIKDAAYASWWDKLTKSDWYKALNQDQKDNLIGLRVRWQWPQTHIDQAPHTREFRIYYQDGALNTVLGNTLTVTSAGNNESIVTTDIPLSEAPNRFAGAALYVGEDVFVIVGSDSVSRLRVRVRNVGARNEIAPRANAPCTIATPAAFASGLASVASGSRVVTGAGTNWTKALEGMVFQIATDLRSYRVVSVSSQTHLTLDKPYEGVTKGDRVYSIRHPRFIDYTTPVSWQKRYYVVSQDQHWTPGTDAAGKPVRNYEIFLPVPEEGAQPGVPLTATLSSPIVYAHVGVSAADDKTYTPDDPKWTAPWANRPGNEGRVGPPAKIFRVLREKPAQPVLPRMPEQLSATRVDQNGASFYTFRWLPLAGTMTHLFRAYDEAIFKTDWSQRPRGVLDPVTLGFFPSESIDPRWNLAKRQQVANELNKLNTFAHDEAGTALAFTHYRSLSADALRVLAGLRETDAAFTQLTASPLYPNDPANENRRGPDDPASFQLGDPNNPLASTALRSFVDSVDGLLKNRYFYRAANIDAAHNPSLFSLSTPAVSVPDVRPLEAPVITRVLSGDHRVLVRWTHGHPVDVSRFNLYRTDQPKLTDPRTMLLRETVPSLRRMVVTVEGTTRLRYAGGVQEIIGVYRRDGADPLASPPHNQPPGAINFWLKAGTRAVMLPDTDGYGGTLYGLGALPAGTEVTIVFRDKKGIERLVDSLPLEFDDKAVDAGRDYFYCLTAVRVVIQGGASSEIESAVSRIVRCRPVGLSSQTSLR